METETKSVVCSICQALLAQITMLAGTQDDTWAQISQGYIHTDDQGQGELQ